MASDIAGSRVEAFRERHLGEEIANWNVQGVGELHDDIQGGVAGTRFDGGEVGAVQFRTFGELLLGPTTLSTQPLHPVAKSTPVCRLFVRAAGGHMADNLGQSPTSPYSISDNRARLNPQEDT